LSSKLALFIHLRSFFKTIKIVLKGGPDMLFRDELTGLFTRRIFKELALEMLKQAMRSNMPISVMMADMDGLRKANNTYGHGKGDELLRLSAGIFMDCVRTSDIVGRRGGDEFIILFPDTSLSGAAAVGEKLKSLLHRNGLEWSFGVAEACFPNESELSHRTKNSIEEYWKSFLESLIDEADSRLYQNKPERR